jgi:hypothetical protein
MRRATRRAAWFGAASLVVGIAAWLATDGDRADFATVRTASAPAEPQSKRARNVGAAVPARRRERRREEDATATDAAGVGAQPGARVAARPAPPDEVVRLEKDKTERRARLAANVRPAAYAPRDPKRIVARDWTPAKETLASSSGRTPSLVAPRDAAAATNRDADKPLDDAALDLAKHHGLRGDYFDFLDGDITDIPDVAGLAPTFSRIDPAIDFDTDASFATPFVPDTFVVRWTGFLRVPEDGDYRFIVGSDDGARVKIDDVAVIDQPRLRAYGETRGTANLAAGLHPIEIVFYENYGYASCRLWWSGPTWTRKLVAPEFLTPPAELADFTPPVIASVDPPSGFVGDAVTIRGAALAGAGVTFDGVPAEITSAAGDRIEATVPVGAATGDVVVTVGGISSLPRRFEVKNLLGLFGEYFKLSGELHEYPDFAHLAPFFVRLDPNLDFMDDNLWRVPYDPDVFAARYTGFLYAPADDDYRVTLGCDDGARVTLDDQTYIDLPGLHPYAEQSRTTHLAKGFHPIEVIFFENYGAARLALYWQRGSDATRSVIPEGFFYAPRELSELPPPTATSVAPSAAEIGGEIEIRGTGFGSNERLVRVVFPGEVWARPTTVDDEHVRVRVPYGVESGALHVEVGIQSSNPLAFTVATPQGLVADWFAFTDRASLEAVANPDALSKLTPNVTRVESGWQRVAPADWNLPLAGPTFAVHWHGTLGVEYPTDVGWILRAAAGAWLSVDGAPVVDCGPWHGLVERYGGSHLAPGEHRFDLWFVQSGGDPKIQLLYTPIGRLDHLPVPGRWFLPREPQTGR